MPEEREEGKEEEKEEEAGAGALPKVLQEKASALERYLGLAEKADKAARDLSIDGGLIGRVALDAGAAGEPGRVVVLIPPEWWVKSLAKAPEVLDPGYYLIAVDPKTLTVVLLVVEEARPQPAASAGGQTHVELETHKPAAGEAVAPIRVVARMASAKHIGPHLEGGEPASAAIAKAPAKAAGAPPDPNSPVAIPRPEIVRDLVFSVGREDYYTLGVLGVLDTPYRPPFGAGGLLEFPLPWSVARKHLLITGTTGSGKTSLVKNLLANAVYRHEAGDAPGPLHVLVLDASGDFRVSVLPGNPEGDSDVLERYVPCWRARRSLRAVIALPFPAEKSDEVYDDALGYAEEYATYLVEREAPRLAGKPRCRIVRIVDKSSSYCCVALHVKAECDISLGPAEAEFVVAPFALKVGGGADILRRLVEVDPYLTERARDAVKNAVDAAGKYCRGKVGNVLDDLATAVEKAISKDCQRKKQAMQKQLGGAGGQQLSPCIVEVCDALRGTHESTLRNLLSRLRHFKISGLVVGEEEPVCPADYASLASLAGLLTRGSVSVVVADLDYPLRFLRGRARELDEAELKVVLGYMLLRSFASFMEEAAGRAFLIIDEAHLFFPRDGEREEWSRLLLRELKRVTRLGRSRGISVVFSTHRPTDVDRAVFTLANTKIYMRTDVKTAREAELPEGLRERLPFFRDHAGVVESYYIRGGYATVVGAPSILGHRLA